jgi:hypothetical protein
MSISKGHTNNNNMNTIKSILSFTQGKRTYIICGITIVYAITGFCINQLDGVTASNMILGALAAAGIRSGINSQNPTITKNDPTK